LTDAAAYKQIKQLLLEIKPDIVHTHSAKAGILGRYAGYAVKGKFRNPNTPGVVHTIHGLAFHPYQNALTNKFYIAIEKATARKTDAFISVADAMTKQAIAAGIGREEQFTTAYSAIEEKDFLRPLPQDDLKAFRHKYGISDDAVVLVTVARLFELKGHDYIIESAKTLAPKFKNCVWLFVGDGILTGQYKQQIKELGLEDRFKFTGLLPPSQIPLAIQASDILVHCSLREGLARAIPQGMLCGKPAISFDVDGAREVVNNSTGRLIRPKDVEQLVEASAELLANKSLRDQLGQSAQNFVKTKFAPETMVDTIESVYRSVLNF
jgi:glycosyltransferase involved in cell wall biosynthesis